MNDNVAIPSGSRPRHHGDNIGADASTGPLGRTKLDSRKMFSDSAYWPSCFSSEIAPSYSTKVFGQMSAAICSDVLASDLLPRRSSHSPA